MRIKHPKWVLLLVNICLCTFVLQAQKGAFLVGIDGGFTFYQGDISSQSPSFKGEDQFYGGQFAYQLSDHWMIETCFHKGNLSNADTFYVGDSFRLKRQFNFETSFTDVAIKAKLRLFTHRRLNPYLSAGTGLVFFETTANLLRNEHIALADLIKKDLLAGIPEKTWFIPLELGATFEVTDYLALSVAMQFNITFTDYLDGVSYAANPLNNDYYGYLSVGTQFRFNHQPDIDKDGIPDAIDECPFKPGVESTMGCPDTDADGIKDSEDRCVYAAGAKAMQGCPDTDKDGTADPYDRCPTIAGPPEVLGCPVVDTDHDGIDDHLDACPLKKGPPERNGCPAIDSDLDGILDEDDLCPQAYGLIIFDGCPDTDGDGIEDTADACPFDFGLFEEKGCPVFTDKEEEIRILSRQKLQFGANHSVVTNFALLDKLADFMHRYPNYELSIRGFADPLGTDENPNYISQLRSEKVLLYLQSKGVPVTSLITQYFGAQNALSLTPGLRNQAKNRRVEFVLVKH